MATSYTRRTFKHCVAITNESGSPIPIGGVTVQPGQTEFYVITRWYNAIEADAGVKDAVNAGDLVARSMDVHFNSDKTRGNAGSKGNYSDRRSDDLVVISNKSGGDLTIDNQTLVNGLNYFYVRQRWLKALENDPNAKAGLNSGDLLLRSPTQFYNSRDCRGNSRAGAI